jgi:hypothetical protein
MGSVTRTYPSREVVVVSHSKVGKWLGNITVENARYNDCLTAKWQ